MSDTTDRSSSARFLMVAASLVIVLAGAKAAAPILVSFLLAVFVAVITAPLFLGLQRRGVPSSVAILLMVLLLVVVGFLGVGMFRTSLNGFTENLPRYQDGLQEQTKDVWVYLETKGIDTPGQTVLDALDPQVAMRYLGTLANTLSGVMTSVFLILLVVIFILLEAAVLPAKVRALPGLSEADWARLQQIVDDIRRYMSLKTVMSLLTGVLVGLWAAVMGVDYPIFLGFLAFFLNYVPNIGSFLAAIPGVLLAFIEFGAGTAGMVTVGYVVINVGISNVLEPRFLGRGLGLSPLIVLLSMIFWGWILGPVGMLLSVPLTMTVKIVLESGEETRWIALLMGSKSSSP